MNTFMNGMKNAANYTYTENGAITHRTTHSDLLDMFALGGAYRNRSDDDVKLLFRNAFAENPVYALKCLFYLRDVRGGQGERRFFRTCMRWLANTDADAASRNLKYIPTLYVSLVIIFTPFATNETTFIYIYIIPFFALFLKHFSRYFH